jgi:hypothetical protein
MSARHRLIALLGVATLTGCVKGGKFRETLAVFQTAAKSVVLCQTTESDLRRQLGEPSRDGILHRDRIVAWNVPETEEARSLAVLVDARGVVTDLYWDVPTAVPWVPANQCSGPQAAASGDGARHEGRAGAV